MTVARRKTKTKKTAGRVEVTLAEERSTPVEDLANYALWFYGVPKIGKTTLSSRFDRAHHFMFEPGGKALAIYQRQVNRWDEFNAYVGAFAGSDRFATATVDVVEAAYRLCFSETCKKLGIDHPHDENDYGKSWGKINEAFMAPLSRLISLPDKGVVFLSHAVASKRKTADGDEIDDVHPALSGRALDLFAGAMDLIGYMHTRRGQRVVQIVGDEVAMAGHRLTSRFRYSDGSRIKFIPLGEDEAEGYDNFIAAFENRLDPPPEEIVPARRRGKIKRK